MPVWLARPYRTDRLQAARAAIEAGAADDDWDGVDPLGGAAISAETCRARYASLTGPWRAIVGRSLGHDSCERRDPGFDLEGVLRSRGCSIERPTRTG